MTNRRDFTAPVRRLDYEPPPAIAHYGWRYHHIGVPTETPRPDERYLPQFKMYVTGFNTSPYGVEWMRFENGSPLPDVIRVLPHIAFEVDNLDEALDGQEVLFPACEPSNGVRSAMILHNGGPVELLEFQPSGR
jgi:hypothetical protein